MYTERLNYLASKITAFENFGELIEAGVKGYSPSLYPHAGRSQAQKKWNAETAELADWFDKFMSKWGCTARAWRGSCNRANRVCC